MPRLDGNGTAESQRAHWRFRIRDAVEDVHLLAQDVLGAAPDRTGARVHREAVVHSENGTGRHEEEEVESQGHVDQK